METFEAIRLTPELGFSPVQRNTVPSRVKSTTSILSPNLTTELDSLSTSRADLETSRTDLETSRELDTSREFDTINTNFELLRNDSDTSRTGISGFESSRTDLSTRGTTTNGNGTSRTEWETSRSDFDTSDFRSLKTPSRTTLNTSSYRSSSMLGATTSSTTLPERRTPSTVRMHTPAALGTTSRSNLESKTPSSSEKSSYRGETPYSEYSKKTPSSDGSRRSISVTNFQETFSVERGPTKSGDESTSSRSGVSTPYVRSGSTSTTPVGRRDPRARAADPRARPLISAGLLSESTPFGARTENAGTSGGSFLTPRPIGRLSTSTGGMLSSGGTSSARGRSTPGSGARGRTSSSTTPRRGGSRGSTPRGSARLTGGDTSGTDPDISAVTIAILEGTGHFRGNVGTAYVDLLHPGLHLSEFDNGYTYTRLLTMIDTLRPREVLMPHSATEGGHMSELYRLIKSRLSSRTMITTVQRKLFDEKQGRLSVKTLRLPEYESLEMEINARTLCLSACAALFRYVEYRESMVFAKRSMKIDFTTVQKNTMIDITTLQNLEVTKNALDASAQHSLYGVMRHTKTQCGARLLRSDLEQPPRELSRIQARQEAVSELREQGETFSSLRSAVSRFLDLNKLLSLCVQIPLGKDSMRDPERMSNDKITQLILLKNALDLVEPLRDILEECKAPLLKEQYKTLTDAGYGKIREKIVDQIHEDVRYVPQTLELRLQKCYAVRENINGYLDIARRTYAEVIGDVRELVEQYRSKYSLKASVAYNLVRGFHITINTGNDERPRVEDLPEEFIKASHNKKNILCTTRDLLQLNTRINEAEREIFQMTSVVVTNLFGEIYPMLGCLYRLVETVALLDVLLAFSHSATCFQYVKPEFLETTCIKSGRHPILEQIPSRAAVPNDTFAQPGSNFQIITGPNMSGKSTYLRQIALLQIMAQVGSFVPAEYACFRLADQIFSRLGRNDDIALNASTFSLEMKEMDYILRNASADSLIIIDELGRGTNSTEAVGLCFAIGEELLKRKSFTFFVTHFMELTGLADRFPNVNNYHFAMQREKSSREGKTVISYNHVLCQGPTSEKHYGLQLAEVSCVPDNILSDAKEIATKIDRKQKASHRVCTETQRRSARLRLMERLKQTFTKDCSMDLSSSLEFLKKLKLEYEHLSPES